MEVISGLMYWGVGDAEDDEEQVIKNQIMTTSWDSILRFFDDDDPESRIGELRSETVSYTHLTLPTNREV